MTTARLNKNIKYLENELKGLQTIDYTVFNDAERWLMDANKRLKVFEKSKNDPGMIAFEMLAPQKTPASG